MATLQFAHTSLFVKHLYDNNGQPYFQIRVPKDLTARFSGKSKISRALKSENGAPVVQVQRLAKKYKTIFRAMRNDPSLTYFDEKLAALALLDKFDLKVGDGRLRLEPWEEGAEYDDQPHLAPFLDELVEAERERGLQAHERLALKALQGPLPTTLSELLEIYLDNHKRGKEPKFRKITEMYWDKLLVFVSDMPVEALDRDRVKAYVANRLSTDVTRATIEKEVKILRAIINRGITELGLQMTNPFEKLIIPEGSGKSSTRREKFSVDEHRLAVSTAIAANDELRTIVLVVALTGCRLGEAVGLRVQDCYLDVETPCLSFEGYGLRRFKTANSERKVPLLSQLKEAIQRQLERIGSQQLALFPKYNDLILEPAADSASAALNKWIRNSVGIAKTCHSFRHSVQDLMREAEVPEDVRLELLGWGRQKHADSYGDGRSLALKLKYMDRAFLPIVKGQEH
jgi:integrase